VSTHLSGEEIARAIDIVTAAQFASIAMLQRKMQIGFARAFHLLEELERRGIVGPADGVKPRDVLVPVSDNSGAGRC
jgi:S-DNA-T family DNA segregation ATPase FtsK/SpoIIIE